MNRYQKMAALAIRLERLGLSVSDADALRRIEMALSRWSERECNGEVERDEKTGKAYGVYGQNGPGPITRYRIADKETGALKRVNAIMSKYPTLWFYHQGDPRGCALYVGRKADLRVGDALSGSYSSRGVAICI